ncbi:MAG: hypothetical protein NVSMB57_03050 [Actinomycetota bacterium]
MFPALSPELGSKLVVPLPVPPRNPEFGSTGTPETPPAPLVCDPPAPVGTGADPEDPAEPRGLPGKPRMGAVPTRSSAPRAAVSVIWRVMVAAASAGVPATDVLVGAGAEGTGTSVLTTAGLVGGTGSGALA